MRQKDVRIGGRYVAKISNRLTTVEILGDAIGSGWIAKNINTGRRIRIKSAAKLREEVS